MSYHMSEQHREHIATLLREEPCMEEVQRRYNCWSQTAVNAAMGHRYPLAGQPQLEVSPVWMAWYMLSCCVIARDELQRRAA